MQRIVRITVEGGVIQHVECPQGVKAIVRDYDADDVEDAKLSEDDDGNKYIETIWREANAHVRDRTIRNPRPALPD